jgi:hypothetical protein
MTTRFDGSDSITRSLHGELNESGIGTDPDILRDTQRLQILYTNVISTLNQSLNSYSDGSFEYLNQIMPETVFLAIANIIAEDSYYYNDTVTDLSEFSYDSETFTDYRNMTYDILDGIKQSLIQYETVVRLEEEVDVLTQYKNILEDRDLLIEYLQQQQQTSSFFRAEATFSQTIELKPWFRDYLEQYGAPNDGVFKTDILADIIKSLLSTGEITNNDVFNVDLG